MAHSLRYGVGHSLSLRFPVETLVEDCAGPLSGPASDVAAATLNALQAPLEFPPLTSASVPGDQITVAISETLPCMSTIVTAVIDTLLEATARPDEITVLLPNARDVARYAAQAAWSEPNYQRIKIEAHTPDDREALRYLAASRQGNPIYFNRRLCDADLVIPIEVLTPGIDGHDWSAPGSLFPTFSDTPTQARYLLATDIDSEKEHAEETREATWLLGVQVSVQVIPGPGNQVLHVLAGQTDAVQQMGRRLSADAWRPTVDAHADLVIATIEGGPELQTWEYVGRALASAARLVEDGGAIALFTNLRELPGPALTRLVGDGADPAVSDEHSGDFAADRLVAHRVHQALRRASIYLVSELPSQTIENLGITHVERPDNIQRLGEQCDSCILLANAQYAAPTISGQGVQVS